jgi:hypothetical protein
VFCWFVHTRGVTSASHVEPSCVQLRHAAPPEPHALFAKPRAHVVLFVQQPAQLPGPHLSTHWRVAALQTFDPGGATVVQSLHA